MLCGGHVGRAHGKKLEQLKTKSPFSSAFIPLHKEQFPGIISAKCCCAGKNHTFVATQNKAVCGCIGPGFIQNAIITVPLSMLVIALINIGKLCWPWEDITVKISMNGKDLSPIG